MGAGGLSVALLSYRSKPHCGGQGVYVRYLSRELAALGHRVTVFSGPPYPDLDEVDEGASAAGGSIDLVRVPSLDLYREPDPFRIPRLREYRDGIDVLEVATMLTGGFPEPRTFSLRAARILRERLRAGEHFDVVHDNQTLGDGLLDIQANLPLVTTIHHPISQDLRTDLAAARGWRRLSLRRWYGFVRMQARVARRLRHLLTVSHSSARDIVTDFGLDPGALQVVPLGVDTHVFHPRAGSVALDAEAVAFGRAASEALDGDAPSIPSSIPPSVEVGELDAQGRVVGRLVAMASADTPLKGVDTLLHALVGLPEARELVLVATPGERTRRLLAQLGLEERVRFVSGVSDAELAALLASAQVACVPSRYEGFSLPAVEAMACGTPVVASRAGALPEVLGDDGLAARLVPPGDAGALREALHDLLTHPELRGRMGAAGRERAVARFDWSAVAVATTAAYRSAIAAHARTGREASIADVAGGVGDLGAERLAVLPASLEPSSLATGTLDPATSDPATLVRSSLGPTRSAGTSVRAAAVAPALTHPTAAAGAGAADARDDSPDRPSDRADPDDRIPLHAHR